MDFEAVQLDVGDTKGLATLEVEWRLKAEIGEGDDGLIGRKVCRDVEARNLSRRPDAQARPFGLEAVFERHVEVVELDAGMKMLLETRDDAGADEGLGAVHQERGNAGEGDENEDNRKCGP